MILKKYLLRMATYNFVQLCTTSLSIAYRDTFADLPVYIDIFMGLFCPVMS